MQTKQRSFNTMKRMNARYADPMHDIIDVKKSTAGTQAKDVIPENLPKKTLDNLL